MFFAVQSRRLVKEALNLLRQHELSQRAPTIRARRECAIRFPLSAQRAGDATPLRANPFVPWPPSREWDSIRQSLLPSADVRAGEFDARRESRHRARAA